MTGVKIMFEQGALCWSELTTRDTKVAEATAYPKSAILPGVTRGAVLELAEREKIDVKLASIDVTLRFPLIGSAVKRIPEDSGKTMRCTTTASFTPR